MKYRINNKKMKKHLKEKMKVDFNRHGFTSDWKAIDSYLTSNDEDYIENYWNDRDSGIESEFKELIAFKEVSYPSQPNKHTEYTYKIDSKEVTLKYPLYCVLKKDHKVMFDALKGIKNEKKVILSNNKEVLYCKYSLLCSEYENYFNKTAPTYYLKQRNLKKEFLDNWLLQSNENEWLDVEALYEHGEWNPSEPAGSGSAFLKKERAV